MGSTLTPTLANISMTELEQQVINALIINPLNMSTSPVSLLGAEKLMAESVSLSCTHDL
jgi:hypothetical protein